jgi:hypothetical protein
VILRAEHLPREVWARTPAGILVPWGTVAERSVRTKSTLTEIKANAHAIRELYRDSDVRLPATCGLAQFIGRAVRTAEGWAAHPLGQTKFVDLFAAMHLSRIARAVLALKGIPARARYLRRLARGELDFFKRKQSDAKNVLFELEFFASLRSRAPNSELRDPPDIVLPLSKGELGIACKKVYSERSVEKTLSVAVSQVKDFAIGAIALNIDEVIPGDHVVKAQTLEEAKVILQRPLERFQSTYSRYLDRYLGDERIVAVTIEINSIVDAPSSVPRFNLSREVTIWSSSTLSSGKEALLEEFKKVLA